MGVGFGCAEHMCDHSDEPSCCARIVAKLTEIKAHYESVYNDFRAGVTQVGDIPALIQAACAEQKLWVDRANSKIREEKRLKGK